MPILEYRNNEHTVILWRKDDGIDIVVEPQDLLWPIAVALNPEPYVEPLPPPPDPKLVGIEFEGVMCSATVDDQNGLAGVLMAIQFQGVDFAPTRFQFSNGNSLVISISNYQEFAATWLPFRQSFFPVE